MSKTESSSRTPEGLWKDSESGHYRVQPGYEYLARQYRIQETWLDEDDNLWIDAAGVERQSPQILTNGQSDLAGAA